VRRVQIVPEQRRPRTQNRFESARTVTSASIASAGLNLARASDATERTQTAKVSGTSPRGSFLLSRSGFRSVRNLHCRW
jgi:hypothetical protein